MKGSSRIVPFFRGGTEDDPARVVPGLLEWTVVLGVKQVIDGFDVIQISAVDACCWYATPELTTAGFIVRTTDQRRFHVSCKLEGYTWDFGSLTAVQMGRADPLPSPPIPGGPAALRWHTDVEPHNAALRRQLEDVVVFSF